MAPSLSTAITRSRGLARIAQLSPTARKVRRERLTYLSAHKLCSLEGALRGVLRAGVPGDLVECGVALGGSGIVMARRLEPGRTFHGFDLFGTIPPPGEHDPAEAHERFAAIAAGRAHGIGGGDDYYGYVDDLQAKVEQSFAAYGVPAAPGRVELHAGLFEDALVLSRPVALAHVDSDWHDPVACCLERISAVLSPGGLIVVDDYNDYGGCRTASHEFLAGAPEFRVLRALPHLILQRIS